MLNISGDSSSVLVSFEHHIARTSTEPVYYPTVRNSYKNIPRRIPRAIEKKNFSFVEFCIGFISASSMFDFRYSRWKVNIYCNGFFYFVALCALVVSLKWLSHWNRLRKKCGLNFNGYDMIFFFQNKAKIPQFCYRFDVLQWALLSFHLPRKKNSLLLCSCVKVITYFFLKCLKNRMFSMLYTIKK